MLDWASGRLIVVSICGIQSHSNDSMIRLFIASTVQSPCLVHVEQAFFHCSSRVCVYVLCLYALNLALDVFPTSSPAFSITATTIRLLCLSFPGAPCDEHVTRHVFYTLCPFIEPDNSCSHFASRSNSFRFNHSPNVIYTMAKSWFRFGCTDFALETFRWIYRNRVFSDG